MTAVTVSPWIAATADQVGDRARRWILNNELARLVTRLGGPRPSLDGLHGLRRWSATRLDSRRGAERREAAPVTYTADAIDALVRAAGPLGLLDTPPPQRNSYDAIMILAGATTGNRLRTRLTRSLLDHVETAVLVAVASDRAISASEIADDAASEGDSCEWRNLLRHIRDEFGPLDPAMSMSGGRHDQTYRTPDGLPVRMLVAPSRDGRRPTTPMQLRFLRAQMAMSDRRTVLLVTSSIYAPYQFFSGAAEVLADGAEHAELIGTETSTTGDRGLLGQRLAQEIHAGIDAAVKLLEPF